MVTIELSGKTLGIGIIVALLTLSGFLAYKLYLPKTGYATGTTGTYDGFSSYEEMMQAHHGGSSSSQGLGACGVGTTSSGSSSITNGETTDYGLTLDENGYAQLLNYDRAISLDSNQMKQYVGLNVHLPQCCDFKFLQASGNCECGHHIALSGLAKLLISKGYSREQVQQEIDKWKLVFYPEGSTGTGEC